MTSAETAPTASADNPYANETVAVWLQLEPGQKLAGEGIGQHLAKMLQGWSGARSGKACLLAPRWARPEVEDMLRVYDLPRDRITTTYFGPPGLGALVSRRERADRREIEARDLALAGLFRGIPLSSLLVLLAAPFAPFLLLLLFVLRVFGTRGRALGGRLTAVLLLVLRASAYASMARWIDAQSRIAFCIVPIGTWSFSRLVRKKPTVVQIPDVVFLEFPEIFDRRDDVNWSAREIQKVADHAGMVISVSEHVRRKHVMSFLKVPAGRARIAPHAPMGLDGDLMRSLGVDVLPTREQARERLRADWARLTSAPEYLARLGGSLHWLSQIRNFGPGDRPMVYFPTQYRPYKNLEAAVAAIHRLKATEKQPPVLLLTADLSVAPSLMDYIVQNDLFDSVVPLPRLKQPAHALVYAASDLALAASKFEGGFPFLFSEALSVGTPVIMAETPIVKASLPAALRSRMLFAPENVDELAFTLKRALKDEGLYMAQSRVLWTWRERRSWSDVVNDYLDGGRAALEMGPRRPVSASVSGTPAATTAPTAA